jgi:hypothetical protein
VWASPTAPTRKTVDSSKKPKRKSEGPSPYVKGLHPFLTSSTTLSLKSNYTAELVQRFRSRQVDVELYGQGCKTLRWNRAGTRPVRGCRREVAAGDHFPAVFRLTQACGGSTLRGPSGGIPPSTTGRQFVGAQRRGEDGYAVVVETAVGTFDRGVGSDRARVLRVWERIVLLGLEEDCPKEHKGALECA